MKKAFLPCAWAFTFGILFTLCLVVAMDLVSAQQPVREWKLFGLVIYKNDAGNIDCKFLYRNPEASKKVHKSPARNFCQANQQAVRSLGQAAIQWGIANPIADPIRADRIKVLKEELEAEGYTVTEP